MGETGPRDRGSGSAGCETRCWRDGDRGEPGAGLERSGKRKARGNSSWSAKWTAIWRREVWQGEAGGRKATQKTFAIHIVLLSRP